MVKLRECTLVFLVQKENKKIIKILLAMKKRGFGAGRWNGVGGKVHHDIGETVLQAAKRETKEEISVELGKLEKIAKLEFRFPEKPEWDQLVHVFITEKWDGKPMESEEMKPRWFAVAHIPYKKMWPDDIFWLSEVIKGKKLKARFDFSLKEEIISQKINLLK